MRLNGLEGFFLEEFGLTQFASEIQAKERVKSVGKGKNFPWSKYAPKVVSS